MKTSSIINALMLFMIISLASSAIIKGQVSKKLTSGTCQDLEYIFSFDVSGSMLNWPVNMYRAAGLNYRLLKPRLSYWINDHLGMTINTKISYHMFNESFIPGIVDQIPNMYALPTNILQPSGDTNYNHAIKFLTYRLYSNNSICYTLVTDRGPQDIKVSQQTGDNFLAAYFLWELNNYLCSIKVRIIDISNMNGPVLNQLTPLYPDQTIDGHYSLQQLLSWRGIIYQHERPQNADDIVTDCSDDFLGSD